MSLSLSLGTSKNSVSRKPLKSTQMQGARKPATFAATQVREDCRCSGQRSRWVLFRGFLLFFLLLFPYQSQAIDQTHSFVLPQPPTQTKKPVNYITSNQSLQSLIAKANQLFLQGHYEKALDPLMQAYEKAPKNIRVNNMLGSIFYKLKNYQLAHYYWGKSLSLDGKQEMVRSYFNQIQARN